MKKLKIWGIALGVIAIGATSCNKYEEGGSFSIRSKMKRLTEDGLYTQKFTLLVPDGDNIELRAGIYENLYGDIYDFQNDGIGDGNGDGIGDGLYIHDYGLAFPADGFDGFDAIDFKKDGTFSVYVYLDKNRGIGSQVSPDIQPAFELYELHGFWDFVDDKELIRAQLQVPVYEGDTNGDGIADEHGFDEDWEIIFGIAQLQKSGIMLQFNPKGLDENVCWYIPRK